MSAFTLALTDIGRARINVHFDFIVHVFLFSFFFAALFVCACSFISLSILSFASRARASLCAYSGAIESRVWRSEPADMTEPKTNWFRFIFECAKRWQINFLFANELLIAFVHSPSLSGVKSEVESVELKRSQTLRCGAPRQRPLTDVFHLLASLAFGLKMIKEIRSRSAVMRDWQNVNKMEKCRIGNFVSSLFGVGSWDGERTYVHWTH